MLLALRIVVGAAGAGVVAVTVFSAVRTVVVPRGAESRLTVVVFRLVRWLFLRTLGSSPDYERADSRMSLFAPVALITLPFTWLTIVVVGYALVFLALDPGRAADAVVLSGSSVTTLGFTEPEGVEASIVAFTEAAIGLFLIALLITYLPAMYGAFSRRELLVASLETAAGAPPSPLTMLIRYHTVHGLDDLDELWPVWNGWFADIEESHTSLSAVAFFRSPQPDRSWVAAAGTVLDAAALRSAVIDMPRSPNAELCIRAGFVALRRIAASFGIPFDPDPQPDDPTSVTRHRFDEACDTLRRAGIPLRADQDQAFVDFNGWRVNYDEALRGLADLTLSLPEAHWSDEAERWFHEARKRQERFG